MKVTKPEIFSCQLFFAVLLQSVSCSLLSKEGHQAGDQQQAPIKRSHKRFRKAHSFIQSRETLVQASGQVLLPPDSTDDSNRPRSSDRAQVWFQQFLHRAQPEGSKSKNDGSRAEDMKLAAKFARYLTSTRILLQLLFGVWYYILVVSKYPKLEGLQPTPEAVKLQSENAVAAIPDVSFANLCFAFCCSGPLAAHTFESTGVLNYWPGYIAMTFLPCCTLWVVNTYTDLNEKLGGFKKDPFMGLFCACCCSCCVIAQDAEAMDLITGARTHLCIVIETKPEETSMGFQGPPGSMGSVPGSFQMIYSKDNRSTSEKQPSVKEA